jgi:predicted TPR repeat methyltransferase
MKKIVFLNLGKNPIANNYLKSKKNKKEFFYNLKLIYHSDTKLISLAKFVAPKKMFNDKYAYRASMSKTMRNANKKLAKLLLKNYKPKSILEIGSNDGTLLREIDNLNVFNTLIGVDPANNINTINAKQNDEISYHSDFFDTSFTKKFLESNPKVDVVVARNVLSHVPDLHEVFMGISNITTEKAELVIEFHESSIILREVHYDSIYHEHTYYHNIKSMTDLLTTHGFFPYHLEESPISGGSFVLFASKLKKEKSKNLE